MGIYDSLTLKEAIEEIAEMDKVESELENADKAILFELVPKTKFKKLIMGIRKRKKIIVEA